VEIHKDSALVAPTMSRASTKRKNIEDVDRVEDSEDFDEHGLSSDEDDDQAIPAKPLDSRPPPQAGKKILPNFGVDAL
jgi:hypothetical protein